MQINHIRNFIRKCFRFGLFIPLSNLILLYGKKMLPVSWVTNIVQHRNNLIDRHLNKMLDSCMFIADNKVKMTPAVGKAPIWFCWLQGEGSLPAIPSLCLSSIRKYSNGHPVIVLTMQNYSNYVELPPLIIRLYIQGKLKNAHFADILRVSLLYQQGGLWLDSTVLLTQNLPDSVCSTPFYTIKNKEFGHYVSRCRWAVFVLGGWRHNPLYGAVSKLFYEYLLKNNCFVDYFMFDHFVDLVYRRNPHIRDMIDNVPFNNPNVHALNALLCLEYNEDVFNALTQNTFLFKLNWKCYTKEDLEREPNSLYSHLKSLVES